MSALEHLVADTDSPQATSDTLRPVKNEQRHSGWDRNVRDGEPDSILQNQTAQQRTRQRGIAAAGERCNLARRALAALLEGDLEGL
eukprot:3741669-Rhodomonas_salina.1